jgi:hypothetical protein
MIQQKRRLGNFGQAIIAFAAVLIIAFVVMQTRSQSPREDLRSIVVNIPLILGNSWSTDGPREPQLLEDLKGRPPSLIGRADIEAGHIDNYATFIDHSVFLYVSAHDARERYDIQDEVIFYQLPDGRERYFWSNMNITTNLNADEQHIACKEIIPDDLLLDIRCTGIFLYGRYIAYVNMWTTRDGVQYISTQEMERLFSEIDTTLGIQLN